MPALETTGPDPYNQRIQIVPMAYRVSKNEFDHLVEEALAELPPPFDTFLEEITIEIRQRPTSQQRKNAGLQGDELLLGLYHGRPRTDRHVDDGPALPDKIFIFQDDVELASETRQDLVNQVRTTVLHEIGHHFGMSEEYLDDLGYG
jgi:predicted Zn-dependent protease with MMP-like domain